jgi:hypothetical protein
MPDPFTALVVGGSQLIGSSMQADAAGEAAGIQAGAAQAGIEQQAATAKLSIEEQRRQFDALQKILQPYVDIGKPAMAGYAAYAKAGPKAFEQQQALTGLLGPERQKEAIAQIEQGGGFQASVQAGEEALLQRASATGGLRGGNIQAALSQFRPQMLQAEIERQYGRLGGFSDIGRETQANLLKVGQSSAAGVGAQGIETGKNIGNIYSTSGTNISNLLGQQGAAQAGGALGEAKAYGQLFNLPSQLLGFQYGAGGKAGLGFGF